MKPNEPAFPFFMPVSPRSLSSEEKAILRALVDKEAPRFKDELESLAVVGRCGCGECPIVFFAPHSEKDNYTELAHYLGKDGSGGLVGVLLWEKEGHLAQLEFYSFDGHGSWSLPVVESLVKA